MPNGTYQQVRDVVSTMRKAHEQLRDALEEPRSHSGNGSTELMLKALHREEQELQVALARYDGEGKEALMNTWLQYVPDGEVREALSQMHFTSDMTADEVAARKLEFDQAFMEMLRQLARETSIPRVEEFFQTLLTNMESRTAQNAWAMREYQAEARPPDPDR